MEIIPSIKEVTIKRRIRHYSFVFVLLLLPLSVQAEDSEINRRTLAGINVVYVVIEDLQPNVTKYSKRQATAEINCKK